MSFTNLLIETILSITFLSVGIALLYITIGTYLQKLIFRKDIEKVIQFVLRPFKIWTNDETKSLIRKIIQDPNTFFMLKNIKLIDKCEYDLIISELRKIDCSNIDKETIYDLLNKNTRNSIKTPLIQDPAYASLFIYLAFKTPEYVPKASSDQSDVESAIQKNNKKLIMNAYIFMGIYIILSLIVVLLIYILFQPPADYIMFFNIFILLIIVLIIEFIFYKYVIGNFKPIDIQLIYTELLKSMKIT